MRWWGSAALAACAMALLAGVAGHGMWAAVGACIALGGVGILILRLGAARQELDRLREDTHAVVQCLSGGLITTDASGRITQCNPAARRILDLGEGDLGPLTIASLFGERAPLLRRKLQRSLDEGAPIHRFEMQLARVDGEPIAIGLSTSVMRDSRGQKTGLIATFQDLSEVRRMQDRVRRADRLAVVGQLAASIAHEIRNPLAAIANSVDMLREELVVSGEHRRLMDLVVVESERLNRILDDFLEYARTPPLDSRVVPVWDALTEVVDLLRRHPDVGEDVRIELSEGPDRNVLVCVDEDQMKQAYVNLAVNAFEAMQHRGTLRIGVERLQGGEHPVEGPWVRITFHDSGPGVELGSEQRIFEPFHTTKPQGTGLGLSIAARIVESHGGRLEASNHPQGGAQFAIDLPEVTGRSLSPSQAARDRAAARPYPTSASA